eukprot:TRINITY_DN23636_c0_g1_i1.p1 TRINITY_DN23636_c0_g1~~TRINITY_DN23636_c0_g1_i1.p1  ORF type:complete len:583 (-),score=122.08 TRINITY_DN23636_c0_g1_i1:231-1979(-)
MDFDDLDNAEESLGPSAEEMREELMKKQVPEEMPGAKKHPRPSGKGFGAGAQRKQKVLYLHGPGSNAAMAERQVSAAFKNLAWVVDFGIFDWHFLEGTINNKVEEIHADPAVQQVFIPYGKKCGDTYDGYLSYVFMWNESHQDETWLGPSAYSEMMSSGNRPEKGSYAEVMDALAKHLEETGPYDALCGFDMGACLAFDAARLAQEGDARFEDKFRYLMLFSCRGHRAMGKFGQGEMRPSAPLQIPTFLSWSEEDDSKQYSNYEDLALYIHPKFRRICLHDQGHRPPNMQKNSLQAEELNLFVDKMQSDTFALSEAKDPTNALYKEYWLPLLREPVPQFSGPCKLIVVEDPLREHGPTPQEMLADRMKFPAQEMPETCAKRLDVYRQVTGTTRDDFSSAGAAVELVQVPFSQEHRKLKWHPQVTARDASVAYAQGAGRSRWFQAEDEITLPWESARRCAEELLEGMSLVPGESVALVGIGTGAHVAFCLAEALLKKHSVVTRLFTVCAPTVWPWQDAPVLGALVKTPIRYLTCAESVAGPPWRLETATFGEFTHQHFDDKAGMIQMVLDEMRTLNNKEGGYA